MRHQSGILNHPGPTDKTKKNGSGETIIIDRSKTSDTKIDGTSMTGTVIIEAGTITVIDMIVITPLAIIGGGMTNEETMQIRIGAKRDIGTTNATIKNGMLEERSVGNRQRIINGSRIETSRVFNQSNED